MTITERLAEVVVWGPHTEQEDHARQHLDRAVRAGKDWRWSAAEQALVAAIAPEGTTGYAWHRGATPLQHAIAREERIMYGDAEGVA